MTETLSPLVWRRRVANELRRLREAAGCSQRDAAQHLGCRVPKISLIEGGQRNIRVDDLTKLLELYQVPEDDRDFYITAAGRARGKAWWDRYEEGVIPDWFKKYLALEQGANIFRAFSPTIFHGLLQTPEYAAAVLAQNPFQPGDEVIRRKVAVRQRRKEIITREADPVRFTCLTDESTLYRLVGGREVMARQLEHIATLMWEHPNVTYQIIPYDRGTVWMDFQVLSFPWPEDPGVVFIEHLAGGVLLESLDDVDAHIRAFRRLRDLALSPEESLKLIERTAADYAR